MINKIIFSAQDQT